MQRIFVSVPRARREEFEGVIASGAIGTGEIEALPNGENILKQYRTGIEGYVLGLGRQIDGSRESVGTLLRPLGSELREFPVLVSLNGTSDPQPTMMPTVLSKVLGKTNGPESPKDEESKLRLYIAINIVSLQAYAQRLLDELDRSMEAQDAKIAQNHTKQQSTGIELAAAQKVPKKNPTPSREVGELTERLSTLIDQKREFISRREKNNSNYGQVLRLVNSLPEALEQGDVNMIRICIDSIYRELNQLNGKSPVLPQQISDPNAAKQLMFPLEISSSSTTPAAKRPEATRTSHRRRPVLTAPGLAALVSALLTVGNPRTTQNDFQNTAQASSDGKTGSLPEAPKLVMMQGYNPVSAAPLSNCHPDSILGNCYGNWVNEIRRSISLYSGRDPEVDEVIDFMVQNTDIVMLSGTNIITNPFPENRNTGVRRKIRILLETGDAQLETEDSGEGKYIVRLPTDSRTQAWVAVEVLSSMHQVMLKIVGPQKASQHRGTTQFSARLIELMNPRALKSLRQKYAEQTLSPDADRKTIANTLVNGFYLLDQLHMAPQEQAFARKHLVSILENHSPDGT